MSPIRRREPQVPFWANPGFVLAVILGYLAIHLAIRATMGPGLSVDDAEQALFSQHYAWAYRYRAPPLFTWMLVTLNQIVPVSALSIGLLRYVLIGFLFGGMYAAARRLIADPRLAALSVYSFAAIGTFAEASHRNLTHSTTLAALLALTWALFARLATAPTLGWYLALGAVFGLGILAKWNFVVLAAALPLACLLSRETRPLVLTWRVVPATLVAVAIVTPTLVATLAMGPPPGEDVQSVLGAETGRGLGQIAEGTWRLLETALVYSLPLLLIVLAIFGASLWRGLGGADAETSRDDEAPRPISPALVGMTVAIGLALLWAFVLVLGATEFKVRYLYPVLLIVPVWLLMVAERGRPSGRAIGLFALVMAAMAIFVAGKRLGQATGVVDCGLCLEERPYPALAARLSEAGYRGGGTILAQDSVAGNLRVAFPEARVIDPTHPQSRWPAPRGEGQCLLAWETSGEAVDDLPEASTQYLNGPLGGIVAAPHSSGVATEPMLPTAEGHFRLAYVLFDAPNGDCR